MFCGLIQFRQTLITRGKKSNFLLTLIRQSPSSLVERISSEFCYHTPDDSIRCLLLSFFLKSLSMVGDFKNLSFMDISVWSIEEAVKYITIQRWFLYSPMGAVIKHGRDSHRSVTSWQLFRKWKNTVQTLPGTEHHRLYISLLYTIPSMP